MIVTAVGRDGIPLAVFQLGASQNVAYNAAGGASTQSTAFSKTNSAFTEAILLTTTTNGTSGDVRIKIGQNPVADATSTLIPAKAAMVFRVNPGDKLAVLSNDAGTGSISITELISYLPHTNDGTQ